MAPMTTIRLTGSNAISAPFAGAAYAYWYRTIYRAGPM